MNMQWMNEATAHGIFELLTYMVLFVAIAWPVVTSSLYVYIIREAFFVNSRSKRAFMMLPRPSRIFFRIGLVLCLWVLSGIFALIAPQKSDLYTQLPLYNEYVALVCTVATIVMYVPGIHWPKKKSIAPSTATKFDENGGLL